MILDQVGKKMVYIKLDEEKNVSISRPFYGTSRYESYLAIGSQKKRSKFRITTTFYRLSYITFLLLLSCRAFNLKIARKIRERFHG